MALPDIDTVLGWRGRTIIDRSGEKIGKFDEIYLDSRSDLPEWAEVKIGLLGRDRALVPLADAREAGDDLQVPFDKAQVEAAPDVDADGELSQEEEAGLYRHYGMEYSDEASDTVMPRGEAQPGTGGDAAPAGATQPGDGAPATEVTRSEEDVDMGVERRPRERVRLKKYVVTDHVTKTVPVQREEVAIERDPVEGEPGEGAESGR